jgi:hypothetical protein
MAPGKCGFALDYSNTFLITDPIDRIVIRADDGLVISTAYARDATLFNILIHFSIKSYTPTK